MFLITLILFLDWNPAALATGLGTPAPHLYLVYSGPNTDALFTAGSTSTATTTVAKTIYLVLDLANPTSFSVLAAKSDGTYTIHTRILSNDGSSVTGYTNGQVDPTVSDPTQNFIWGVSNDAKNVDSSPTKGYAVLRYSGSEGTDTVTIHSIQHTYPKTHQVYATGALTGLSNTNATTILAANSKTKVSGVYTIPVIPTALTNYIGVINNANTISYPTSVSGLDIRYEYDPSLIITPVQGLPALYTMNVSGTVTLSLNTTLTGIANVSGGSYKLKGQGQPTVPMNPVAGQLNSGSSVTVYEDFLYQIALSLGLASGYHPSP